MQEHAPAPSSLAAVSWVLVALGGLLSYIAVSVIGGPDGMTLGILGGLLWLAGVLLQLVLVFRLLAFRRRRRRQ